MNITQRNYRFRKQTIIKLKKEREHNKLLLYFNETILVIMNFLKKNLPIQLLQFLS